MNDQPIIYVVDDDSRIRESLEALLSSYGHSVKTFGDPQSFLHAAKPNVPSCLILDLNLGQSTGLELQKEIAEKEMFPIIFLSGYGDIPSTVKAIKAGATEFLSKPVAEEELLAAVEEAMKQAREQWEDSSRLKQIRRNYSTLTPRERDVLPFVVRGFLNKQTAYELGTSEITVRIHRGQIMRKMGADSLADLVRMAGRIGIP